MANHIQKVKTIMLNTESEGKIEGLHTGLQFANRIALWWMHNEDLKEPHSRETLEQWTEDALKELQRHIDIEKERINER